MPSPSVYQIERSGRAFPFPPETKGRFFMKKHVTSFFAGICAALALGVCLTTALAASGQVSYNFANVSLDGTQKIAAGEAITAANGQKVPSSILYTDEAGGKTNYLPIRAISELLGVQIGYDSATKTVLLGQQPASASAKETGTESLLPPAEHDGVTVTPLRLLGAKNRLYLALEIRAPEGTVFHPEDSYHLFSGLSQPAERRTETAGHTGSFTVLEAGTKEPNILVGVAEETASFDIGGCSYIVRALYRSTPGGEQETIFEASDNTAWKAGTWDILIPEDLNRDQVLEPMVEGITMTEGQKTMTLLSMSVSPLGIWWKYRLDGEDPWLQVRMALRMKDGSEMEAAPGQLTMGDMGSGCTAAVSFEKPVDLSQAAAVLWGDAEIPLGQPEP